MSASAPQKAAIQRIHQGPNQRRAALAWARSSDRDAEVGEPARWFDLGLRYSTGEDAPLDYVTAHAWFNLAAMAGHSEARAMRAELAREMSATDIAAAQCLARQWQGDRAH
jgi:hypothetical protein